MALHFTEHEFLNRKNKVLNKKINYSLVDVRNFSKIKK